MIDIFFWDQVFWGFKIFFLQWDVFLTRESILGLTAWALSHANKQRKVHEIGVQKMLQL